MSCVLYKMASLMAYVMYSILYRLFCRIFYNNNPAFHKTNFSGKTLDTRQKIFCGPLPPYDQKVSNSNNLLSSALIDDK